MSDNVSMTFQKLDNISHSTTYHLVTGVGFVQTDHSTSFGIIEFYT